jgi:hypothetical protein
MEKCQSEMKNRSLMPAPERTRRSLRRPLIRDRRRRRPLRASARRERKGDQAPFDDARTARRLHGDQRWPADVERVIQGAHEGAEIEGFSYEMADPGVEQVVGRDPIVARGSQEHH